MSRGEKVPLVIDYEQAGERAALVSLTGALDVDTVHLLSKTTTSGLSVSFQDGAVPRPCPLARPAVARYIGDMTPRDGYPSDLSDDRWALIEPVLTGWRAGAAGTPWTSAAHPNTTCGTS
ncbi:hypothetical protein GCM10017589_61340 [Streptomyces poonensis]|nr:hypothetical protein GCM10017589_61340 [Streptomyces poonensis]